MVIKPILDGDGVHRLDGRMKALLDEMAMQARQQCLTEPQQRDLMGGVNYNLNRVEIYTRYIEVSTTCGNVPVWIYWPRRMEGLRPALLYVHGGAFKGGTPFQVENACRLIAERADCVVFNIDYALPPEHPYPIPTTQVYETLCHVASHAHAYRVDKTHIYMGGDSAGGNLTAVCAGG